LAGGALAVVLVVAAACGSSAATPAASTGAGSVTTAAPAAGSGLVQVARVGSLGPVLVDKTGMTLYRYTPDGMDKSVCTGGCAALWPPLTEPSGTAAVTGAPGLPASDLGTFVRADGTRQITYRGMPLYTYRGDTKAGEASGQGVGGTWFAVTTASASSPPTGGGSLSTTAGSSGGYGY
jgi:predicted lipoprotein with Yx(FWY)xxD motif